MQMELVEDRNAKIKVVGVGGAGGNAVNRMVNSGFDGVEFIAINTDIQALDNSLADIKIPIGVKTTRGLGAGANPTKALESIHENRQDVIDALEGADMVFITAGMGGGTGTGAAPAVAEICKELDILSVAVVTKPFPFEGPVRARNSKNGVEGIVNNVDTIITIANEKILGIADKKMNFKDAFAFCDGVLTDAVRGISEIILNHGEIQVDFADVKAIMSDGGQALMGTGYAEGEDRAIEAAKIAITSPLLDNVDISGASGILIHITAGEDMGIHEMNDAMTFIYEAVGEENAPNIIFGVSTNEKMESGLSVTVIATGFHNKKEAAGADFSDKISESKKVEEVVVEAAAPVEVIPKIVEPQINPAPASHVSEFKMPGDLNVITEAEEQSFHTPTQAAQYLQHSEVRETVAEPVQAVKSYPEASTETEEDLEVPAFLRHLNR